MQSSNTRDASIDLLKVLATLGILFHHFQQLSGAAYPGWINFYGGRIYWGNLVELFFVLSGFLIFRCAARIREGSLSFPAFYLRRMRRLLPLTAFAAMVYDLILALYQHLYGAALLSFSLSPWGTLLDALGIQAGWSFANPCVNNPTWYISVLLLCCAVFYLLTWAAARGRFPAEYLYGCMILLGCGAMEFHLSLPYLNSYSARGYYAFFAGVLLAKAFSVWPRRSRAVIALCGVCAAGLTIRFRLGGDMAGMPYILTFCYYPALIVLLETNAAHWLIHGKFWNTAGAISFDVYIWHVPVYLLWRCVEKLTGLPADFTRIGWMFAFALVCAAAGTLSHFLLEKPLDRFVGILAERLRAARA